MKIVTNSDVKKPVSCDMFDLYYDDYGRFIWNWGMGGSVMMLEGPYYTSSWERD